jgi:hypothetical protein
MRQSADAIQQVPVWIPMSRFFILRTVTFMACIANQERRVHRKCRVAILGHLLLGSYQITRALHSHHPIPNQGQKNSPQSNYQRFLHCV